MKKFVTIIAFILINLSICFSQVERFDFKEGVEYFTYSSDTLVESKFITFDSSVSDFIIEHLFNNFEYLGENKWLTNDNTITHFYKQEEKYVFKICKK